MNNDENSLINFSLPKIPSSFSLEPEGLKIVLGNGFDLFCGLNTRYLDFFNNEKNKYNEIRKWCESFVDLRVYIDQTSVNWRDFGPQYEIKYDFNIWDIYFALGIGEKNYDWCDIETEMLNTFTKAKDNFNWHHVYIITSNHSFNLMCSTNLEHTVAGYIIYKNPDISTENKFYAFLLNELKKFEINFGNYVNSEYCSNYDNYLKQASIFFSFIDKFNEEIKSIDTFNYTNNGVMKTVKECDFLNDIKHINGDFKNPIFGIDSSKVDVKSNMVIFTKVSRRLIGSVLKEQPIGTTFDNEFDHLVVFGHSLCEHDYNYFFPIFDYLQILNITKNSTITFVYYIYDDSKKEEIILGNIRRVANLIGSYENYAGKFRGNRLLDSLTAQGRIELIELAV